MCRQPHAYLGEISLGPELVFLAYLSSQLTEDFMLRHAYPAPGGRDIVAAPLFNLVFWDCRCPPPFCVVPLMASDEHLEVVGQADNTEPMMVLT